MSMSMDELQLDELENAVGLLPFFDRIDWDWYGIALTDDQDEALEEYSTLHERILDAYRDVFRAFGKQPEY